MDQAQSFVPAISIEPLPPDAEKLRPFPLSVNSQAASCVTRTAVPRMDRTTDRDFPRFASAVSFRVAGPRPIIWPWSQRGKPEIAQGQVAAVCSDSIRLEVDRDRFTDG